MAGTESTIVGMKIEIKATGYKLCSDDWVNLRTRAAGLVFNPVRPRPSSSVCGEKAKFGGSPF